MLDEFAETEGFADEAELGLGGAVGCDCGGERVGAVEVPGVEAGEVLDYAEEFVAANCGGLVGLMLWDRCVGDCNGGVFFFRRLL